MIPLKRPAAAIPAQWATKAAKETADAIAAYKAALKKWKALKSKKKKPLNFTFKYKVYGDDLLRAAINDLYKYKCAYCETFYGKSQPVAVEHYRPKGEVIEGKVRVKPGYYWLAATADNLLPSCTDCNSPRRQPEPDGTERVRGKGNYFPLAKGSKRARSPGGERRENPLLLHPEIDEPEKHLEFLVASDRLGVVRPALINGSPSPKGEASIEVYALDRPQLVLGRQFDAKRLVSHLRNTRETLRHHRANPNDPRLKKSYEDNIADLRDML
ncbi:MAG TPA: hypothetical protein VFS58_00430, partial [Steroidobacteraceae bacterium]|nr:hypothetical protein [Steroidobacteraceae bacterium]